MKSLFFARWVLAAAGVLVGISAVRADEGAAADGPQLPARDPVELAFALPPGVVLTKYQAESYYAVRQQFEPLLRAALDRVAKATDESEKTAAVGEVRQVREQIRLAIINILRTPPPDASMAVTHGKKPAAHKRPAHRDKRHVHRAPAKKKPAAHKAAPKKAAPKKAAPKKAPPKAQAEAQRRANAEKAAVAKKLAQARKAVQERMAAAKKKP